MATANATVRAVLDYLNQKSSSSVPTGAICYFATTAIPTGWLLCNGSNVSRTTYAALFAAIGTKFGTGNGSSTFTLPNLDERFIEGTTTTSDVGKKLEAGLPNITGNFGWMGYHSVIQSNPAALTGAFFADSAAAIRYMRDESWEGNSSWNPGMKASRSSSIYGKSSTVQPSTICFMPCIKF